MTGINTNIPWNTPYMPGYFVNRSELRNKILTAFQHRSNKSNRSILVGLYGLGGVGKTYLALDIMYNTIKNYSFRGWIAANDVEKLKGDYCKLGNELGLFTDDMKEESKINTVKNWLNDQKSVLLVFDSVPNIELIEKYLPQKGDIILTSRNYKIPYAVEVNEMGENEANELLKNLIKDPKYHDKCAELAKILGYLPLAIAQAGAYIEQNKISIDKYLYLYQEERSTLLSMDVLPETDKHIPVYITWNISIKEVKEEDKTGKAIELLNLISFCHFVDIPKIFLMAYLYNSSDRKTEIEQNKLISFLRQYSLLKTTSDTIAIHHLLQDCIRSHMTPEEQENVLKKTISTINKIYPLESKKDKDYFWAKTLFPHMENLLLYVRKYLKPIEAVDLLLCLADACDLGDYSKSRDFLEEALIIQEQYYGTRNHIKIASTTLRPLSRAYLNLGNYEKAKELLEEVLLTQKNHYKTPQHIEIGFILKDLGQVYLWLGDYNKAKELLEESLIIQEKHYHTRQHIEIGYTLRHLGSAYLKLGNYEKAKELLEESVLTQEKHYGKRQHIKVAHTLRWLGTAYLKLEKYPKAKELLEESLEIQDHYYGTSKHIDATFTRKDLGITYLNLGEHKKAKILLEEALHTQESYYKTRKHIEIAFILKELAQFYLLTEDYHQSKTLLEEVLEIQENYYDRNHHEIANTLTRLADLYYLKHDYKNAFSFIERATHILDQNSQLNAQHNYLEDARNIRQKILEHLK